LKVLPLLGKFISLSRQAGRIFRESRPDAVILVDFPGFNWWIARQAKALGIPVFYYCPPQLWAWAPWRVRKMRKLVDHVLCCLEFEAKWYRERGVPAEWVGHPFFDEIAEKELDVGFLEAHASGSRNPGPLVAILPGSRNHEVHGNFPIQLQIMAELHRRLPETQFLVACYKESQRQYCAEQLTKSGSDGKKDAHPGSVPSKRVIGQSLQRRQYAAVAAAVKRKAPESADVAISARPHQDTTRPVAKKNAPKTGEFRLVRRCGQYPR
jgi:lipid A disaccharide synthetase